MRIPKSYNPLSLNVGELVNIKAYSKVEYNGDGHKILQKIKTKSKSVHITGVVKRALGTYNKASNYSSLDGDEYEQAYLSVSKYIWLYETRTQINAPTRLVSPEDIEIIK